MITLDDPETGQCGALRCSKNCQILPKTLRLKQFTSHLSQINRFKAEFFVPQTPLGYHRRNSLRHESYDYTRPGSYFITFCTQNGESWFGQVIDQQMQRNPLGQLADDFWRSFSDNHQLIRPDCYVVMPNHVHVLFWLRPTPDMPPDSTPSKQRQFGDAIAGSVSTLIGSYKGAVTQHAKTQGLIPGTPLWQANFYDRIVRNDDELSRIRTYIHNNPANWLEDQLHPNAPPNQFNRTWKRT